MEFLIDSLDLHPRGSLTNSQTLSFDGCLMELRYVVPQALDSVQLERRLAGRVYRCSPHVMGQAENCEMEVVDYMSYQYDWIRKVK